jgi:hypothetical protein
MDNDFVVILTTLTLYLALMVSPGPNFAFVSRLAISGSRKAAFGASVGFASASLLYALLSITGLAVLLKEVGWLARGVQILGGGYLIYLGLSAWVSKAKASAMVASPILRNGWYGLRAGSLVGLSNPEGHRFLRRSVRRGHSGGPLRLGESDHPSRRLLDRSGVVWTRRDVALHGGSSGVLCALRKID